MLKCPQCGHTQEDGATCTQCGVTLQQTEIPPPVVGSESVATVEESAAAQNNTSGDNGQNICVNCAGTLPQGALFCAMCGQKVEATKTASQASSVQTTSIQQAAYPYPHPPVNETAEELQQPLQGEAHKKGSRKTLLVAVSLAVAFFVCIGVFVLAHLDDKVDLTGLPVIGGSSGSGTGKPAKSQDTDRPFIYLQDKEVLKFRTPSMDRSQIVTDNFSLKSDYYYDWLFSDYLSRVSEDGSYLLYINNYRQTDHYSYEGRGDLYIRDLTTTPPQGETDVGIKIASDTTRDFYISDDNSYVFYITNKNDLYVWDFSEAYKLDSNVTGIYAWTDDKVFYYKGDVDDYYTSYFSTRDCYVAPLTSDGRDKREKVDTDINDVYDWNDDLTQFIYTKRSSGRGSDSVTFDLYQQDLSSGKRETLASNVAEVIDADLESGRVVFQRGQEATVFYEDIIEDDMLELDEQMTEPSMEDYPLLNWYYNEYDYYSDDVDYDQLEEEFDAYEEAMALYEGKEKRDRIREQINNELESTRSLDICLYELYYIEDGETRKIDSDIYVSSARYDTDVNADLDNQFVTYVKADLQELPKLKLSEMQGSYSVYSFDLEEYITSNLTGEMYIYLFGGAPKLVISKEAGLRPNTHYVIMSEDGAGIYFQATDVSAESEDADEEEESISGSSGSSRNWYDYDDYWDSYNYWDDDYSSFYSNYQLDTLYNLYYVSINGNSVGEPVLIDRDIEYLSTYETYLGKNVYLTKGKNDQGDFYVLNGSERERIAYDVSTYYPPEVLNNGSTVLFFEDYDANRSMGSLFIIKGESDKERITDSVYEYYYRGDDLIYLLCNFRGGKGDLYLYDGTSVTLIDYDVSAVADPWYGY